MRLIRLIKELVQSVIADVRQDFTPDLFYVPYEPNVIGNKLKERDRDV